MTDPAIRVEHLGKQYRIGSSQLRYKTIRDSLMNVLRNPLNTSRNFDQNHIWALKDVSFEIQPGEVVGVIGKNGAGKSTLLKVLAHITGPSEGRVEIYGRIGSLLEVGTGFHPELTGRENIYLNGAVLGMKRTEINRKFDEIVNFAEVEKFLDTPVKHYSSGMYMRLAFAVAAHLEPEILLVDEVLAVGDAEFQKKCLGKMGDVAKGGRTVLFVSHNMGAISTLCKRGVLLQGGAVRFFGEVTGAISCYNGLINQYNELSVENCTRRGGSGGIRFQKVWLSNSIDERINSISSTEKITINMEAIVSPEYQFTKNIIVGFSVDTEEGQRLITCVSSWVNYDIQTRGSSLAVKCTLPFLCLVSGKYFITASIALGIDTLDYVEHCYYFEIGQDDESNARGRNIQHGNLNIPYTFGVVDVL